MTYLRNMNQRDALFNFNLFQQLTSTCFEQASCSSSAGTTAYVQQLVCVMLKIVEVCNGYVSCVYADWLLAASQHKHMTYTNRCTYTVVPADDEQ